MKPMLLISIIFTVLSIVYIVLAYYGFIRYMKLKKECPTKIVESYLKLPRAESKSKVVVSLYTDNLTDNLTLKSILDQTVHPDQIVIVSNKDLKVPDFLKTNNIVITQKANENYGKTSAFMVPLLSQKDENTKIIIVSDGVVYGLDFIETLIEESENNPEDVIVVEMFNARSYTDDSIISKKDGNVIRVSSGVLIKPKFFRQIADIISPDALEAPCTFLTVNTIINGVHLKKSSFNELIRTSKEHTIQSERNLLKIYAHKFSL